MRLYLIAIFVAVVGLWVSSEVQAGEACVDGVEHIDGAGTIFN